jgi:Copper transport outer membrane protein, MctB
VIDFRYHLVSIISVFLALALGIVVGTTALNGAVVSDLRHQVKSLKSDKKTLQGSARELKGTVAADDDFAAGIAPDVVAGKLTNQEVLVVTAPGADTATSGAVAKLLQTAGASVTTQVDLAANYVDPRHASDLQGYATSGVAPAGLTLPTTDDSGKLAGALLADVLIHSAKGHNPTAAERQTVLAGFTSQSMLRVEGPAATPASLAVLVVGKPAGDNNPPAQARTITDLAAAFQARGTGVVIAGSSASDADTGVIGTVRQDTGLADSLSSVDNADTAAGQIATVLALRDRGHGVAGQYGTQDDAQAAVPSLGK